MIRLVAAAFGESCGAMPIVSFLPYYPDEKVDRTAANFHLWNWRSHREKRVPDPAIRMYLDKYFGLYRRADGSVERAPAHQRSKHS